MTDDLMRVVRPTGPYAEQHAGAAPGAYLYQVWLHQDRGKREKKSRDWIWARLPVLPQLLLLSLSSLTR